VDYLELSCIIHPESFREIVIARLADEGFEMFEETDTDVKAYVKLAERRDYSVLLAEMKEHGAQITVSERIIQSQNWNAVWESNFQPVKIGDSVYIYADFHPLPENIKYPIRIQPKMAFGTGHHATTRLMMMQMLDMEFEGKTVLDAGCGTGILSILASKLGATEVIAFDNDAVAVENTVENAARNDCNNITAIHSDASCIETNAYDIILANINRNIIVSDMHRYRNGMKKGAVLLLSGFYLADIPQVTAAALSEGLTAAGSIEEHEWASLKFV
jgi:ribosomal protein L11 methyltransferase